jgi:hypothetical protein
MSGSPFENVVRLAELRIRFQQIRIDVELLSLEIEELEIQFAQFFIAIQQRWSVALRATSGLRNSGA